MTKLNFIKIIFAVLISTALAEEVSSKAIYDSQTKILSLEGVLFPSIEEFTGKAKENKGIFDIQLQEKNKWVFELIPWSVNLKSMFDGENTSSYILYDHNSKSINIPCVEISSNDNETEGKYYKDMTMKLNGSYPIFHAEETIETDSCEIIPQKPSLTTTPTTTPYDAVEVQVNGKVGTTVFVNGVDSGKTIDSTGKVKVTLDTSGEAGDKSFSITLKDSVDNESEALTFTISKQDIILTEGLVAHYEFENNANDSSGNGNHGTKYGGVSYTDGVIGKAGSFGGVSNKGYIEIQNNSSLQFDESFSISFWFNTQSNIGMNGNGGTTTYGTQTIMAKSGDRRGFTIRAGVNNNELQYPYIYNGRCCTNSGYTLGFEYNKDIKKYVNDGLALKKWHHLIFEYKNNKMYLYVNGQLENISDENKFYINEINTENLHIGIGQSKWWYPFNGFIDDLRIYNRALNESEIKQLYKLGGGTITSQQTLFEGNSSTNDNNLKTKDIFTTKYGSYNHKIAIDDKFFQNNINPKKLVSILNY